VSVTVSAVCSEAEPLKIGARSQAIDWEVVYSDMTDWRRFGRAPPILVRAVASRSLAGSAARSAPLWVTSAM